MTKSQRRTVYPVPDRFIPGIPTAAVIADSAIATRLVRTGAFTRDGPEGDEPEGGWPEPLELTDDQVAILDHYDNVDDVEEAPEPEDQLAAGGEPAQPG